jgi:hypothetical protein
MSEEPDDDVVERTRAKMMREMRESGSHPPDLSPEEAALIYGASAQGTQNGSPAGTPKLRRQVSHL